MAVVREIEEEVGLAPHSYQVVEELPTPISYNFPVFEGLLHQRHDDFVGQDLFWWIIFFDGKLEDCYLGNAKVCYLPLLHRFFSFCFFFLPLLSCLLSSLLQEALMLLSFFCVSGVFACKMDYLGGPTDRVSLV